jgi:glycerol-3-phosphate dehydrogenase
MSHRDDPARLDGARRDRELADLRDGAVVDVLVIGGGITGAGVALDAASRGLSVALVEREDLAHGTSRWSSKLVHGGLRYLASGHVAIAQESAMERGILMTRTAPHLVRAMPMVVPLLPGVSTSAARLTRTGFIAGDVLRAVARTPRTTLPRPRRVSAAEAVRLAPGVRRGGLRGALVGWDGQLEDDARLVVAVARTAAAHGARMLTRVAAEQLAGDGARVRDRLTGEAIDVRARTVVNAAGVWAGELADGVTLRPSRGTHLVVDTARLGGLAGALHVPVPGERNRWVFAVAQPGGRAYVGLTDVDAPGPVPDVPEPTLEEIGFLVETISGALQSPLEPEDVRGAYAGLRPLLEGAPGAPRATADLSRRHAVLTGPDGVITVVGGKLTTYRRMAQDAVDAAVAAGGLDAAPCRTATLPLAGAAAPSELAAIDAPRRLVERYGAEAPRVVALAGGDPAQLAPLAEGLDACAAELRWALAHELALDAGDLLDRRTRIGLVPEDRARALPVAEALVAEGGGLAAA